MPGDATLVIRHPRLLFVLNNASFFLSHRLPIARAARDLGFDVHIATPPGPAVALVQEEGFPWHPFRLSRSGMSPAAEAASILALTRLYRRIRPDVVHHVTPKPVLYGTVAARLARVPGVVNAISGLGHAFSPGGSSLLRRGVRLGYRVALRHRNMAVIFQNPDHRREFLDAGWVLPGEAELIPGSGVDVEQFRPRASTTPASSDGLVVMLAARLLATKGVREFVDAARALRPGTGARFVLVGEPDPGNPASISPDELAAWTEEGCVENWGFQSDMASTYQRADIACLPSYTEGMPKSLIEAAACGLPMVASDEPGCRAVVAAGETGLLVPVGNAAALAKALERLIGDADLRARLGASARRRAVADFAIEGVIARHLSIYQRLLASR